MLQQATDVFDNLDGKFLARLREISSNTRTTADGKATITFKTARIEASYSQITHQILLKKLKLED
jgi:hypothetical protein